MKKLTDKQLAILQEPHEDSLADHVSWLLHDLRRVKDKLSEEHPKSAHICLKQAEWSLNLAKSLLTPKKK